MRQVDDYPIRIQDDASTLTTAVTLAVLSHLKVTTFEHTGFNPRTWLSRLCVSQNYLLLDSE